jgi:hypothetical protein
VHNKPTTAKKKTIFVGKVNPKDDHRRGVVWVRLAPSIVSENVSGNRHPDTKQDMKTGPGRDSGDREVDPNASFCMTQSETPRMTPNELWHEELEYLSSYDR